MQETIPLRTDDAILAFGLYNAGFEEFRPPTHTYTEQKLQKLGYHGMSLMEAANTAWKRHDRGAVDYWFCRTPELPHFLKVYAELEALIKSDEKTDGGEYLRGVMARNAAGTMDEREALFRATVVVLKCRIDFVNRWKAAVPCLRLGEPARASDAGANRETFPDFKLVPINATPEHLAQLGL